MSKIIDKLEEAIAISKVSADNENYLIKMTIKDGEEILKALSALKAEQPKCLACGGLKEIPNPDNEDGAKEIIPCPACQPKAENERITRAEQYALMQKEIDSLQAENKEQKELIDRLCSQEPCPKCGYGVTGVCYGCIITKLKAELEGLEASQKTTKAVVSLKCRRIKRPIR